MLTKIYLFNWINVYFFKASAENTSLSKVLDNTELVREGTSSNNLLNNDESTNKNHKV